MHSLRKNHRFTIRRTLVVNEPFGMHECIPYETTLLTPISRNTASSRYTDNSILYHSLFYISTPKKQALPGFGSA